MSIRGVDHINIATEILEETRSFYVDILGLEQGWRPDFTFQGYWLYAEGRPIVHLQQSPKPVESSTVSALNHFAFAVTELDQILAALDERGIAYTAIDVPGTNIRQAFLMDPNGVRVELNYRPG